MLDLEQHINLSEVQRRDLALEILNKLEAKGGYYIGGGPENAMKPSPETMGLTRAEHDVCESAGPAIFGLWEEANQLYIQSINGRPDLQWVAQAVEGPITDEQRRVQRQLALQNQGLPLLARADLTSIWNLVEIQERLGGLGLMQCWLESIREVDPPNGNSFGRGNITDPFSETLKQETGKENPTIGLISPEKYILEQTYFASKLEERGIPAVVIPRPSLHLIRTDSDKSLIVPHPVHGNIRLDFLYRREVNAAELAETQEGMNIVEAVLDNKVLVEPNLNMLYDSKIALALAHHPMSRTYFSDQSRAVATQTALVPKGMDKEFTFGGQTLTMRTVLEMPNKQRKYVLKYGGPNIEYGFGGRAVYCLEGSRTQAEEIINYGMTQISEGHPWVLQHFDKTRYEATWLERDGTLGHGNHVSARMMIFYRRTNDNSTEMFAGIATNRPDHWKAAGNPNSIVQELRVR